MKANLRVVLALGFTIPLLLNIQAAQFELTFSRSTSETNGLVASYAMWIQATNATDSNRWQWIGQCKAGQTNIVFDSTNLVAGGSVINTCWVTATANDSNSVQSAYATPILFDTNNYPVVVTNVPPRLIPPTLLSIQRL